MKVEYKEKAFTLIELLAVIVILAIVALVATPIVLNVINSSRDKANLSSAYGIADAARLYYNQSKFNGVEISEDNLLPILTIGGKKPELGDVRVNSDGEVTIAVNYDNKCYYKGYKTGTITVSDYDESTCLIDGAPTPNICFAFEPETGTITGYNVNLRGCGSYVVIPNQIDGVDVEVIGECAFCSKKLANVTIPNSVTLIGRSAFINNNFASVIIPSSVTSIGDDAFSWNNLTNVIIPSSVTTIGESAFNGNNLTSVTIPSSVTSVGAMAFNNNSLNGSEAYIYKRTSLGIDYSTIVSYGGISKDITIPGSFNGVALTSIEEWAFSGSNLISVIIPNGVTSIGDGAFYSNDLTSVTISSSVTSIGEFTFSLNNLLTATIPSSVISIGENAFSNNDRLLAIKADPTKGYNYTNIIGSRYTNGYIDVLNVNTANTTTNCFEFNSSNGTITRYKHWYDNCTSEVVIPTQIDGVNVTKIAAYAFYNGSITSVTISEGITIIGENAFYDNNLESVTIPNSVISIGESVFNNNNLNENDAYIYKRTSSGIDYSTIISYGGASKDITIPGSFNGIVLTSIGEWAFSGKNLASVTIPNSVNSIGNYAFYGNDLTSVTIPNSVTSIGKWAFYDNNLTSVTIPNSVTSIGTSVFSGNRLTNVIIPNSVTSVGDSAFSSNALTSVVIPSSITTIESHAFYNNNIEEVTLPSSLTSLGENAFSHNPITTLTIPNGVTSLSSSAFRSCLWLTDIYIYKPENSITGAPWGAPKATVHWQD